MRDYSVHEFRENLLADVATSQYGRISVEQLRAIGFSADAVARRVRAGRLHRLHRGVYAVGHSLPSPKGNRMAAVLAVADSSLGFRSAGAHIGLRRYTGTPEVVVARGAGRTNRPGIIVHRVTHLDPADLTTVDGIPTTTWARTTLDLAAVVPGGLTSILARAEQLRLFDRPTLDAAIVRAPRHRGIAPLLATLAGLHPDIALTDSELEVAMAGLLDAHGLPPARFQVAPVGEHRVDFVWDDARLAVETDGWEGHGTRAAFQADRASDRALLLAGWRVLRFTHADVVVQPRAVAADLRVALAL
jgi:very-short-patch-repair endonuclease